MLQKGSIIAEYHRNHDKGKGMRKQDGSRTGSKLLLRCGVVDNLRVVIAWCSNCNCSSMALIFRESLKGVACILDCIKACEGVSCMKEDVPSNKDTNSNQIGFVAFDPEGGPGSINEGVDHVEGQRNRFNVLQDILFSEDWRMDSSQWIGTSVDRWKERKKLLMVIKGRVE